MGVLFLPVILATSPCPDKSYTLIPPREHGARCDCYNPHPKEGHAHKVPGSKSCQYTISGRRCTATCPSGHSKRSRQAPQVLINPDRSIIDCPAGHVSCPITSLPDSHHECVDVNTDLENCGGCAALGLGKICGKHGNGVRSATCASGVCKTQSCKKGFHLDADTGKCIWRWTP
ncbi:hypothetical protein M378DRAFT_159962 [Amanita muscaria Koide BX008]|uniref:Protein CPL1-like domain-containing protein n=1 Tax=Amanita muscaria (strain Koide BX008) TaxID=946122 RepID=A0A0C2WYY5_AMAMK|nr:hypothetical protein M378DRAFT_159962 [Amanita muscaria Koide BX008]